MNNAATEEIIKIDTKLYELKTECPRYIDKKKNDK